MLRSEAEIEAIERLGSAAHEAGHIVLSEHFGVLGVARIFKHEERKPDETTWLGRVERYGRCEAESERVIGVGGAVGELVANGEDVDPSLWEDLDIMSPSDWRLTGCSPDDIYRINGALWDSILEAERLLKGPLSKRFSEAREALLRDGYFITIPILEAAGE